MSAGTLTLTNNSAAVAGSGTAFTTEVAAGDFIVVTVGGIPYTLPVKSVESGAALTLVSNFTGPTQAGAAWSAVPRVALNMVTAALVTQSTEALRGLNYDKQNWQSIFSSSGTATVRLPDGSSFTGPAWGGITTELSEKADKTALDNKADKDELNTLAKKGDNSDITQLTGLKVPVTMITSIPPVGSRGIYPITNIGGNYDVVTKPFNCGMQSATWGLTTSFGMYSGTTGGADRAGPAITVTDGGSFGARWFFQVAGSIISTGNGNITPVASDERVKNIHREISEEEAVEFIIGLKPIRYSFKWSPDEVRVGYSAQNIYTMDPELIQRAALNVGGDAIEDGMIVDAGEVGAAFLTPVVQNLLRRVAELEAKLKVFTE
ncbi:MULTISPECIES: tail fiber domain-containing protein [Citrobacter]|uniref:tail fiber domain-containing protein n=1 Tax=Citrobacter TaxID=544 RepID=UPI0025771828|nr:tail fiber domain-containing protein [Citrobacter sp. Cf118]MDM3162868.1 tail fiber domain-containing protein [Citrobacter sp. Cf118]MEB1072867.1 tail fiber domain-containing protein [Citrobacter freundii]